jgi:hypothetical protein
MSLLILILIVDLKSIDFAFVLLPFSGENT